MEYETAIMFIVDKLLTTVNLWMKQKGWNQSELSRRMNRSTSAVSFVLNGQRGAGPDFLKDLAKAFDKPIEELYRLAGLFPENPEADPLLDRIEHLYNSLQDPANKERAAEFLEFLKQQEKKGR